MSKNDLLFSHEERLEVERVSKSRTESLSKVERAKFILKYIDGFSRKDVANYFNTNRKKVERCIAKAKAFGIVEALKDLPRSGRKQEITDDAKTWVVNLACKKPLDFGYSYELWTTSLLSNHVRDHCVENGYECLKKLARGTVSKILNSNEVKPHKIKSYLDKHDPDFEKKQREVLCFYKKVEIEIDENNTNNKQSYLSYDEKPGIQATENKYEDIRSKKQILRDYEYIRHGTLSLMAGIDMVNGHIHTHIVKRHRSKEFIEFLEILDKNYPEDFIINILLDNHTIHKSKETLKYLKTKPSRFNFTFTPKHASWLNIIEVFFSKMTRTVLRGIRVKSLEELKDRLNQYFNEINIKPIKFRWKYKMDEI